MKTGLVSDDVEARLGRCDEIDRATARLLKEAEAIEAKGRDRSSADLVRLGQIQVRMEGLVAEMKEHHRILVGEPAPARRPSLLRRLLRR